MVRLDGCDDETLPKQAAGSAEHSGDGDSRPDTQLSSSIEE
jgi:hypothetical protein